MMIYNVKSNLIFIETFFGKNMLSYHISWKDRKFPLLPKTQRTWKKQEFESHMTFSHQKG